MSHHRSIRHVEFHETDMAGIAHFARYFLWMEAAEHAFWREIGIPFAPAPGAPGWLWPRVACYFQYLKPVRFGDEVAVCLDLLNIGNTSLTFRCEIWHGDEKIAGGETTCVCCQMGEAGAIEKISIPDDVRARLRDLPKPV